MAVELLRSTGEREFPAQLMAVFLWIASHNGCKQQDLHKSCGIKPASCSRCVTWLGPKHRLEHRSGLKLVRREQDPDDWRAWRLYLTPKGEQFVNLLDNITSTPINQLKEELQAYDDEPDDDQDVG